MAWVFEREKLVECFDLYLQRYADSNGGSTAKRDVLLHELLQFLNSDEAKPLRF